MAKKTDADVSTNPGRIKIYLACNDKDFRKKLGDLLEEVKVKLADKFKDFSGFCDVEFNTEADRQGEADLAIGYAEHMERDEAIEAHRGKSRTPSSLIPTILLLEDSVWGDDVSRVLRSPHCDVRGIFRVNKLCGDMRDAEDFGSFVAVMKEIIRHVLRTSCKVREADESVSKCIEWKAKLDESASDTGFISLFSDPATRAMSRRYKDALRSMRSGPVDAFLKNGSSYDKCRREKNKDGNVLEAFKIEADKFREKHNCRGGIHIPSLLLLGETGCGKSMLARAAAEVLSGPDSILHMNIASISSNEINGALFGAEKGSYTDSKKDLPGAFIKQAGKTVFLDEIGDMDPDSQTRLLTYMDKGFVLPMGMSEEVFAPCYIVAATNRDIDKASSGFRRDIVHRFDHIIRIPSLRERKEDLRLLISLTLQDDVINPRPDGKRIVERISLDAVEHLETRSFPGNFRELRYILRSAVNNAASEGIKCICLRHLVNIPGE